MVLCKSFIYVFIYWVDFCGLFGYLIIDSDDCIYFFIRERKLKFLLMMWWIFWYWFVFFGGLNKIGFGFGMKFFGLFWFCRYNIFIWVIFFLFWIIFLFIVLIVFFNKVWIFLFIILVIFGILLFVWRLLMCIVFYILYYNSNGVKSWFYSKFCF